VVPLQTVEGAVLTLKWGPFRVRQKALRLQIQGALAPPAGYRRAAQLKNDEIGRRQFPSVESNRFVPPVGYGSVTRQKGGHDQL